jgi:uncharacterized OB-fold protein
MKCRDCRSLAIPGGVRCAPCAERRARKSTQSVAWQRAHPAAHLAHALAYQAKNKAAGRCAKCGRSAMPGRTHCSSCAERARVRAAAYRERNRAAGLCVKCGGSAMPEKTLCLRCAERQRARDKTRRRASL